MTSYFRSWLTSGGQQSAPDIMKISPPASDDEGEETEREDNDVPPAFPSLLSAQRVKTPSSSLMLPPPNPGLMVSEPPSSSLALPPSTTQKPVKPKKREKVALAPGHSPLDWAKLKSSGEDLRGVDTLLRVTPSMLKQHRTKADAWSAFNGKVYNITPYLAFHPGGERELMRVAGRDGTKLFAETHAWVNADFMLDSCMVGFLVSEPSQ
ncbi:cytochrome b5 [Mycena floridula]|nr:cytochrome b5 [Mycena floridula]